MECEQKYRINTKEEILIFGSNKKLELNIFNNIYEFKGEICTDTVNIMKNILDSKKTNGYSEIIFDFSGVNYVDSCGLGGLLKYAQRFRKMGYDFKIINVKDKVKEVIEITKLSGLLGVQ